MIRLLVHLHVRLPIPSIAICSTPVPLSQLHTQIHTQWPPLLPKQNFPRSKCPTEENTDKQQSCVHSQTTTSPSQEFIRIPIVKTFVSLSSFSIIQIRHNAQLTPFCHTHTSEQLWLESCQPGEAQLDAPCHIDIWCSAPNLDEPSSKHRGGQHLSSWEVCMSQVVWLQGCVAEWLTAVWSLAAL